MTGAGNVSQERKFCRFAATPRPEEGVWGVPKDGFCLSSFVVLSPEGVPGSVLVGKVSPSAPWGEIGGLDSRRIQLNSQGWMIPSCHLLQGESPQAAAVRVLKEQLGKESVRLGPPEIFSEVYTPRRHSGLSEHWDLEFVFRGTLPEAEPPQHVAWAELKYLDIAHTPRTEFIRSHDEILENLHFRFPE